MDPTEKLVSEYLAHRGYTEVVYEPDGNVTPDFLVNGTIAIEVRRLNQNHFAVGKAEGLEKEAIPLWERVKKLLTSLGAPTRGESWCVFFRFSRPVERWKTLAPKLRKELETFRDAPLQKKQTIARTNGFELDVFRAPKPQATLFVIGGCNDQDSDGWLLAKMETNITYCASEKSGKIDHVRSKYGQWWLALVDYIGYSLDGFERELFRDQVSVEHDWGKIILIDPRDPKRWFEI